MRGFVVLTIEQLDEFLKTIVLARVIKSIHIHHTAVPTKADYTGLETIQNIWKYHTDPEPQGRGWSDIGYHFIVVPDGKIYVGRDINRDPASIYGYNENAVAIAFLGNFETEILKGPQKKVGVELVKKLLKAFQLSAAERIIFHREKANTACPGKNINKDEFLEWLKADPEGKTVKLIPVDIISADGVSFKGHVIDGESYVQLRKIVEASGGKVKFESLEEPIKVELPEAKAQEKLNKIKSIIEEE